MNSVCSKDSSITICQILSGMRFTLSLCKYTFLLIIQIQNPKLNWSSSCALLFDNVHACLWLGCFSHPKGFSEWSAFNWTAPQYRWLSLVPWWGQHRLSPCCRSRRTALWMYFLSYSFFVCKIKYQRVRPWYVNWW